MDKPQPADESIHVGAADLGGVVTSAKGPEAGVWVIAETTDLPTKFAKIVVTDDRGRYVMPDLPQGELQRLGARLRARGFAEGPGRARQAPQPQGGAGAERGGGGASITRPIYWYSMLKIPAKSEFPAGADEEPARVAEPASKTTGCMSCHALGTKGTRTMPKDFAHMNSTEAWARRIASGQAMTQMINVLNRFDRERVLSDWADWTDRIAAGELPFAQPERPQGVERNVVLTLWDWSTPTGYMHDLISTDRRKPTVNANGKLYGAPEESTDFFPVLDPNTQHRDAGEAPGARPEDAVLGQDTRWRPRRTGAPSRSGTARPASTTR